MTSNSTIIEEMKIIVERRGGEAMKIARKEINSKFPENDVVSNALKYFADVTLRNALPVFPTLISLSAEAAGRSTEKTSGMGAAIILIAGAADVHDDIIDGSLVKGSKRTMFGKFGEEVTLLAGDMLLIRGLVLLQKECESLSKAQRERILQMTAETSFEISKAEALDSQIKGNLKVSSKDCLKIIQLKASVPELTAKIGAVMSNADEQTVATLGKYGKTYGIVSLVAEEFIDLLEYREFKNRLENECPPLPILYALQNGQQKKTILALLSNGRLNKNNLQKTSQIALKSLEVKNLKNEMGLLLNDCLSLLDTFSSTKLKGELGTLIQAAYGNLQLAG